MDNTLKKWLHGLASKQIQPLKTEFYKKLLNLKFAEAAIVRPFSHVLCLSVDSAASVVLQ